MPDILIRGMEMPTEGGAIGIYKISGNFYAARVGKYELFPIVELPEHGDLIDRDNLKFHRAFFWHPDPELIAGGHFGGANAVVPSLAIKEAPVIVPASRQAESFDGNNQTL